MTHVFLERGFTEGISAGWVLEQARTNAGCFGLHRVTWHGSFLSADQRRLLCWFESPDAESARIAMRQSGMDITRHWPGTIHVGSAAGQIVPNVIVERSFDDAAVLDELQAVEDANAWCLETRNVKFARTFFSIDRRRMMCLYQAPDAESVRQAQRQAGMPFDEAWAFQPISLTPTI